MTQGRRVRLSAEQRTEMWRRWQAGESFDEVGRTFGKSHGSIQFLLSQRGGIVPAARRRSLLTLTLAEREDISRGIASGSSLREIAGRDGSAFTRFDLIPSRACRFQNDGFLVLGFELLVEGAKVRILLCFVKDVAEVKLPPHREAGRSSFRLQHVSGKLLERKLFARRKRFQAEAGGKFDAHSVQDAVGVLKENGFLAFLVRKRRFGVRLEYVARQDKTFACGRSDRTLDVIGDGERLFVVLHVVDAGYLHFHAARHQVLHGGAQVVVQTGAVAAQVSLTPA